jgi:hypothetical protein
VKIKTLVSRTEGCSKANGRIQIHVNMELRLAPAVLYGFTTDLPTKASILESTRVEPTDLPSAWVQTLPAVSICGIARSETAVAKTLDGQSQKPPGFWSNPTGVTLSEPDHRPAVHPTPAHGRGDPVRPRPVRRPAG